MLKLESLVSSSVLVKPDIALAGKPFSEILQNNLYMCTNSNENITYVGLIVLHTKI